MIPKVPSRFTVFAGREESVLSFHSNVFPFKSSRGNRNINLIHKSIK